ncbi:plexin-B3-like [Mytilus trossulus]|uniref:plexin-B3-like n=1 Tax=Mytilus trossulus TaxID=6551 RepID=UPI0030078711
MQSGGSTFTICSEGFTNVGQITVQRVVKPCDVPENTSTVCETPYKIQNQSNEQTIYVKFDGVTLPINIVYVDVPTFERFSGVLGYDQGSSIKIKGINILRGAHREDYSVHIGLDGLCLITDINMQFITCLPPKSVPRTNKTDENTVHVIVVVSMITAYIGDLQYTEADNKSSLVNALLTGGLVTSVFIGIMAVLISRRNKKIVIKKCNMEMSKDLSKRRKKSRKDNELGHFEDSETPYSEINPVAELSSYSSSVGHQDVNTGYEKLGHRLPRPTNPYNHLQQSVTDNQMPDTTNIENRTKDLLASDYMDLNI